MTANMDRALFVHVFNGYIISGLEMVDGLKIYRNNLFCDSHMKGEAVELCWLGFLVLFK